MFTSYIAYGGAFDPAHLGHATLIQGIVRELSPQKLLIVPSGPRRDKSYRVSEEVRARILELFLQDVRDMVEGSGTEIVLETDFLQTPAELCTTIAQDVHLRTKYGMPVAQTFGSDILHDIAKWEGGDTILREIPKIICDRPGYAVEFPAELQNFYHIGIRGHEISSTEIVTSPELHAKFLTPRVYAFVSQNQLYR